MSVTLSITSKNAPLLIHEGYSYIIDRRTDKKILWKCEYSRKFKCRGRSRRAATFPISFWNMTARVKNNMHHTNNNIEAWHRKLNCAFQRTHPNLWTFMDKLVKEENNIHSDIINAMSGRQPPKRQNESLNNRLNNLVQNPHTDVQDQLKYIGRLLSM